MTERLGQVLYWAGCIVAVLIALVGVTAALANGLEIALVIFFAVITVTVWLIGRACLYVLAGR